MSVQLNLVPDLRAAARKSVALVLKTALIRAGLEHIISSQGFDVVSSQQDLRIAQPSLIVIEGEASASQTAELIDRIKAESPAAAVVVLSDAFDLDSLFQLQSAGANGFCLTTMQPDVLVKALELVALGHTFVPGNIIDMLAKEGVSRSASPQQIIEMPVPSWSEHPSLHKLSQREAHILRMLMRGDANKVIANKLDIAEATVKVHVKAILRKIQVSNRTQAAIWASEHLAQGAISDPGSDRSR
ncbi:LuxR C-terminal-related transcriptional regulator [Microvirga pudoricolor]|uniref:LuxR C-terminal-related transcriptional regulator n=1 Tax=Microvirga pudoricolor TaxID=2778729 RepID=UPI001950C2EA|nr:response regulator transcription factor [Microvirga pudoricolor]MBM6593732.1 response regulator transcription factor [Microvirga pudoricolor]